MLERWKAGVKKIYEEGALGLGISRADIAEGHGVRESKVVFRIH